MEYGISSGILSMIVRLGLVAEESASHYGGVLLWVSWYLTFALGILSMLFSLTPTAIDYREPNISVGPARGCCSQIISRIIGSTGNKNNSGKRNNSGNKQKFT